MPITRSTAHRFSFPMPTADAATRCHSVAVGRERRNIGNAKAKPANWARTKPGTSAGRMPANVSLSDRAIVTAGLANEVEAVNQ